MGVLCDYKDEDARNTLYHKVSHMLIQMGVDDIMCRTNVRKMVDEFEIGSGKHRTLPDEIFAAVERLSSKGLVTLDNELSKVVFYLWGPTVNATDLKTYAWTVPASTWHEQLEKERPPEQKLVSRAFFINNERNVHYDVLIPPEDLTIQIFKGDSERTKQFTKGELEWARKQVSCNSKGCSVLSLIHI